MNRPRLATVFGADISGEMASDMMLEAAKAPLAGLHAPLPIEHLSNNGGPHSATEAREMLGPSLESKSLYKPFANTFMPEYVRLNPLPDTPTAPRQIAVWITK